MEESRPNAESRTLFYEQLNCVPESNPEQIKSEYRRLALRFHPDKAALNDQDIKMFDLIQQAYNVLSDPSRRALYDRWRTSHLQIPFNVFEGLGAHAQTLHWQSLPSQQTITGDSETTSSETQVNQSIPLSNGHKAEKIQIRTVWKTKHSDALYDKFRNYEF